MNIELSRDEIRLTIGALESVYQQNHPELNGIIEKLLDVYMITDHKKFRVFNDTGRSYGIVEIEQFEDDWEFNNQAAISALYQADLIVSDNVNNYYLTDQTATGTAVDPYTIFVFRLNSDDNGMTKLFELQEV